MISISSSNDRYLVTKTFTPLHFTCQHFSSSHLNFTQQHFTTLHYPLIWLNPTEISYCSISPHITTLHLISLHCTFTRFSAHFCSFHFTRFIIVFLTLFLKILGLQGEVPNATVGTCSWFQFFVVLFTKEHFPISVLCFLSLIFRT